MRKRTRPPIHPGDIIKHHHLIPLRLSVTEFARLLGISRKTASGIINGKASITPNMALRLSRAFNTTPDLWLNLQVKYDLWHAARESKEWKEVKQVHWTQDAALRE
jgi:addiction module HigA family antidote